jgi:hypothetical protein
MNHYKISRDCSVAGRMSHTDPLFHETLCGVEASRQAVMSRINRLCRARNLLARYAVETLWFRFFLIFWR